MNHPMNWRIGFAFLACALVCRAPAAEPDIATAIRSGLRQSATVAAPVIVNAATTPSPQASAIGAALAGWTPNRNTITSTPSPAPAAAAVQQAPSPSLTSPLPMPLAQARLAASRAAIARLAKTAGSSLQVHLRENETVRSIRANELADANRAAATAALSRMDSFEHSARNFFIAQRELLQLDDPATELTLADREMDELAHTHLKFEQRFQGLRVWPSALGAQFDSTRRLVSVNGAYVPTPRLRQLKPRVNAAAAVARAKSRLPGGWTARASEPELIVHAPLDDAARLAWLFDIEIGFSHAWRLVIDAESGRVLRRLPRIFDNRTAGSGIDLTGVSRPLQVWKQGADHFLVDTSKQMFDPATDPIAKPKGAITIADARGQKIDQLNDNNIAMITSANPNSWTIPAGVSAAFNFSQTYDYFLERHNRNSLDGNGGNITAIVQVGQYDNASWHGNLSLMIFGDVKPYPASLDVVGHELAHGVTEKSAALVYELQSGALNESFSDIFGEMVEAKTRGKNDWLMGSELGRAFRNMKNPGALQIGGLDRPYPSKMSEFVKLANDDNSDHGGVHINSSIINHCFYLLAEGLPSAIGLVDAEKIFYRTLTRHLQAQSQFIDCRLGALASAEELYGKDSSQVQATAAAFDAVEIWAAPTTPEPTPIPVVQGEDSTLFVYPSLFGNGFDLGRRESALGDAAAGSVFAEGVKLQRPAVSGDGSGALFVTEDHDLCQIETANPLTRDCFGVAGVVHSIALSPDLKLAAFVLRDAATGQPDGKINVVNLATSDTRSFILVSPAADGLAVDQVIHADSMTFSTDGKELLYDAVSRVRFGATQTIERWSISALNLETGTTRIVVPPLDGIDSGNPAMGRAGNRYVVFDAVSESTGNSSIVVLDQFSGDIAVVGVAQSQLGYPAFTGDESAVVFSAPDGNQFGAGVSLFKQGLTPDRLQKNGALSLWQADANLGVVYRRGAFDAVNELPAVTLNATPLAAVAPATVTLGATASDADGSIARVEFFDGNLKVGEAAAAANGQYRLTYSSVLAGTHRLYARAIDNLGGSSDSTALVVVISASGGSSGPRLAVALDPAGQLRLTATGASGAYNLQRSKDLVNWSNHQVITADGSGGLSYQEPVASNEPKGVYFRLQSRP